ncbi:MAG: HsdR family type I site-specific deoxyribonuclease, partial [Synergistaceae bacterium]|nr:HsdR family type I site-specific deoxyribonuclease [Synergistaceae bacterium]
MASYITEEEIEQALLNKLENGEFGYDVVRCSADPNRQEDLNDGTGRGSKKQCVLPIVLAESLRRLNPNVPLDKLDDVVHSLKVDFSGADIRDKNYELYGRLRSGVTVGTRRNGAADFEIVRLIDFDEPANNTLTAVSQMWIQGRFGWRRPDVLLFVNGLPVVYIELKKSNIPVSQAYDKNLTDCMRDIPNLFAFNQLCVLSNGIETRVGAFSAPYGHFFEWLKTNEVERVDRSVFVRDKSSLKFFADALLHRDTLIDYIENFILFENKTTKIIAKNHQYIGVNNLMESMKRRGELKGRLGVFWHTQGSGKSYSMVMFARKVLRKLEGSFTFLCVTDREDLDTQLYKNFVRTDVIGDKEECQPKNSEQMRAYLQSSKPFVFTLIQKFRYDKGKQYPVLTERDDVIVMVDEAHRTQYKDLAENMRTALPNANFIAFTGTPLLGAKRLTNQWFGDYVSEYNFAQSVDDGSTVPLYYSRRLPEVWLQNNFLDDDVLDIIEQENLNEAEEQRLKNSNSCIFEVIKRDERLDKIAR